MLREALWLGSYLLGSVPFGVLVARSRGVDITKTGSGNIGATNVWRTLGKGPGMLVFALDVMKGVLPAVIAGALLKSQIDAFSCGILAMVGHSISPFLRFKGGKGISTGLGALLGSTPWVALSAFGVFALLLWRTRYVSLASLVAAVSVVVFGALYRDPPVLIAVYGLMAAFIFYRHRTNIQRLREGTERKFSINRTEEPPPSNNVQPEITEGDTTPEGAKL